MYEQLRQREAEGQTIRVALVGAGAMGVGIAWQVGRTPGMELVAIVDIDPAAGIKAAEAHGTPWQRVGPDDPMPEPGVLVVTESPFFLLDDRPELAIDVLVEATNTIGFAGKVSEAAIVAGMHVVLMNAEVDLALGPTLMRMAAEHGVVVTSDAGDQHGVLARMIDEIKLWGFDIRMAGNIKGYLDRYATAEGLAEEARIRRLNPIQCCAYTDGTKLCIEMAVLANGEGLVPHIPGMEGPRVADVREVFEHFDFDRYGEQGVVDYILGAEPGGGVFVVGRCEDPLQAQYLWYYKLGDGPNYLFYRPYHLCHLETTRAIAAAVLRNEAVLTPRHGRVCDVYAHAKRAVTAGETVPHGIGGDHFYGLIERCADADARGAVPIALLEAEGAAEARILRDLAIDAPLSYDDVALPESYLVRRFLAQLPAVATPAVSRP